MRNPRPPPQSISGRPGSRRSDRSLVASTPGSKPDIPSNATAAEQEKVAFQLISRQVVVGDDLAPLRLLGLDVGGERVGGTDDRRGEVRREEFLLKTRIGEK